MVARPTNRAALTKQRVLEAAARIANRDGLGALTLARLASELGVRPPSLYNHVEGLRGLLHDLAVMALRQGLTAALRDAALGRSGEVAVEALAHAYRRFARENPGLFAAIPASARDLTDPELAAASGELVDVLVRVLQDGFGLDDRDALHAVRVLRSAVHGFVVIESQGGFGLPLELDESFRRLIAIFVRGLRQAPQSPPLS